MTTLDEVVRQLKVHVVDPDVGFFAGIRRGSYDATAKKEFLGLLRAIPSANAWGETISTDVARQLWRAPIYGVLNFHRVAPGRVSENQIHRDLTEILNEYERIFGTPGT